MTVLLIYKATYNKYIKKVTKSDGSNFYAAVDSIKSILEQAGLELELSPVEPRN